MFMFMFMSWFFFCSFFLFLFFAVYAILPPPDEDYRTDEPSDGEIEAFFALGVRYYTLDDLGE